MQGWFNFIKSNTVNYHTNRPKNKNHMITSVSVSFHINAEKAVDKIQHTFMTKTLSQLGREGHFLNLTETATESPQLVSDIRVRNVMPFH